MDAHGVTELAPDLHVVCASNSGPMTLDGTRSYVLGRTRVVILDPGPAEASHLDRLALAVGDRDVAHVLLTHAHRDHAALASDAAGRFGAELAGSETTLRRLGCSGRALSDGEGVEIETGLELTALHAPGHSPDHLCYIVGADRRLFTGDLVLGSGSSAILHPEGDVRACLASLARLISLRPTLLLPGHGSPVKEAAARLAEYRRHRVERQRQVERALAEGASTVPAIREAVYGSLPEGLEWAADASVAAHLAALAARGRPVPDYDAYGISLAGETEGPAPG